MVWASWIETLGFIFLTFTARSLDMYLTDNRELWLISFSKTVAEALQSFLSPPPPPPVNHILSSLAVNYLSISFGRGTKLGLSLSRWLLVWEKLTPRCFDIFIPKSPLGHIRALFNLFFLIYSLDVYLSPEFRNSHTITVSQWQNMILAEIVYYRFFLKKI